MTRDLGRDTNGYDTSQRWRAARSMQWEEWSGRQSGLSGTLHMIRRVRTRGNHTLDGSPGRKQSKLYLTHLGVLWFTWALFRERTPCFRASLTQQHTANEGAGRTKTKLCPRKVSPQEEHAKYTKTQRMQDKQVYHIYSHATKRQYMSLFIRIRHDTLSVSSSKAITIIK